VRFLLKERAASGSLDITDLCPHSGSVIERATFGAHYHSGEVPRSRLLGRDGRFSVGDNSQYGVTGADALTVG
jgi:hypothetical protein